MIFSLTAAMRVLPGVAVPSRVDTFVGCTDHKTVKLCRSHNRSIAISLFRAA
jgi:hypothetical protein